MSNDLCLSVFSRYTVKSNCDLHVIKMMHNIITQILILELSPGHNIVDKTRKHRKSTLSGTNLLNSIRYMTYHFTHSS